MDHLHTARISGRPNHNSACATAFASLSIVTGMLKPYRRIRVNDFEILLLINPKDSEWIWDEKKSLKKFWEVRADVSGDV
jgi:hypothetical protein